MILRPWQLTPNTSTLLACEPFAPPPNNGLKQTPISLRSALAAAVYLDHGSGTDRMVVVGTSLRDRVLYVVHVERARRDRIISARPASRLERDVYESGGES